MIQTRGTLAAGLQPGDRAVYTRTFTQADVALFGGVTADGNPYHFDAEFARASRFGRPIVHGLLVGSMVTHIGGQWAWLADSMSFEFVAPVFVGDTVTVEVVIESVDERGRYTARARFVNQRGEEVMRGALTGYPPRPQELALLGRGPAGAAGAGGA
jgi:3-hydroxybutyryl-CoA dehydratase